MKYLYKHGNLFWYQRAVPKKILKFIGVKNIKVSLKTNKIQTAIQRSKLQAIEHKRMFNKFVNPKSSILNLINSKKLNLKDYEIKFLDDYDDYVSSFFFSDNKKPSNSENILKKKSLEQFFFDLNNQIPILSVLYKKYFIKSYNFKPNEFRNIDNSLDSFLRVCGDKVLDSYTSEDINLFRDALITKSNINKNIKMNYIKIIFKYGFKKFNLKNNNFIKNFSKPRKKNKSTNYLFSDSEIKNITEYCTKQSNIESFIVAMIINTGCNLSEILGLAVNDIYIDNFQSFVFIRTNERRTIKNIHKVRSIPLTGISLWGGKKIASLLQKNNGFLMDYKITNIENSINKIIKMFSSLGSLRSFKNRLISKLKEVQCPEEIILELVGRSKKNSLYNRQISLDEKKSWLEQLTFINH